MAPVLLVPSLLYVSVGAESWRKGSVPTHTRRSQCPPHTPFPSQNAHHASLQPVAETRAKQSALWRDLILAYCRAKRVWTVTADGGDADELFCNRAIDREWLELFVGVWVGVRTSLVVAGRACDEKRRERRGRDPA